MKLSRKCKYEIIKEIQMLNYQGNLNVKREFWEFIKTIWICNYQGNVSMKLSRKCKYEIIKESYMLNYLGNLNFKLPTVFKCDIKKEIQMWKKSEPFFSTWGNPAPEILLRIYRGNLNIQLSRKCKYEIIKEM